MAYSCSSSDNDTVLRGNGVRGRRRGMRNRGGGLPRGLGNIRRQNHVPRPNIQRPNNNRNPARQPNRPRRQNCKQRAQGNVNNQNQGPLPAQGGTFNWHAYDLIDPFVNDWLPEYTRRRVLVDTSDFKPVDYFKLYFPDTAFDLIAQETNRYAMYFLDNPVDLPPHSRFAKWEETDSKENQA